MDTFPVVGKPYQPRVLDAVLQEALQTAGAVIIEGARACGKTMTGLNAASSYIFLDQPGADEMRRVAPGVLLEGESPRLLDEWQLAPELWNMVRRAVDVAPGPGQFILTGSALPPDDVTRHTGAGRFLRIRQRPMSWWERGASQGNISLKKLFNGTKPATDPRPPSLDEVITAVLTPGFPAMTTLSLPQARELIAAYLSEVCRADIPRLEAVGHRPVVFERLIRAIARGVAGQTTFATLAADLASVAPEIKPQTVSRYVELLTRLFVVEPQPAWAPELRSRARLRTSPKWHLVDPALGASALRVSGRSLRCDLPTLGLLFESAVFHNLSVLAGPRGGTVQHYRDSNGHEIDCVITLPDDRWAAIEVKLGAGHVAEGAASLNAALAQIDQTMTGPPAFRAVITGTGMTYRLDDGTLTFPLAALAP